MLRQSASVRPFARAIRSTTAGARSCTLETELSRIRFGEFNGGRGLIRPSPGRAGELGVDLEPVLARPGDGNQSPGQEK